VALGELRAGSRVRAAVDLVSSDLVARRVDVLQR